MKKQGTPSDGSVRSATILIVDDDAVVRKTLCNILELEGYATAQASSDTEGLREFRRIRPDLVISDLFMPEKGGLEMIRKLKGEAPELKIIAVSGGCYVGSEPYLTLASSLGATRTLSKPFDRETLLKTIRMTLEAV